MVPPTMGKSPTPVNNCENAPQTSLQVSKVGSLPQLQLLFPKDSSLWPAEIKLARTRAKGMLGSKTLIKKSLDKIIKHKMILLHILQIKDNAMHSLINVKYFLVNVYKNARKHIPHMQRDSVKEEKLRLSRF